MPSGLITPVILAGGSGTRLWPLSREERPKQFQAIAGRRSMFQQTVLRVTDPNRFTAPIIVGNRSHFDMLSSDLAAIGIMPASYVLEPEGRNTAPAITLAAMIVFAAKLSETMLIMPSDHYIQAPDKLIAAIDRAKVAARNGEFVTFGIEPHGPETSYGYIKQGELIGITANDGLSEAGIYRVARFVEKPPRHNAEAMLAEGGFYWNSGMFMLPISQFLTEINELKPAILTGCQEALAEGVVDGIVVHPEPSRFAKIESISIDYALMEHTSRAAVVPTDPLWSDVGSWTAVWEISQRDQSQNVTVGDVILHDVSGAYVRSEGPVTAVVGLNDVIVVNTGDAVIVASKSHAQDIRHIAEAVKKRSQLAAAREANEAPASPPAGEPEGFEPWQPILQQAG